MQGTVGIREHQFLRLLQLRQQGHIIHMPACTSGKHQKHQQYENHSLHGCKSSAKKKQKQVHSHFDEVQPIKEKKSKKGIRLLSAGRYAGRKSLLFSFSIQPVKEEVIINVVLSIIICDNIFFLQCREASLHCTCRSEVIFFYELSTGWLNILPSMR